MFLTKFDNFGHFWSNSWPLLFDNFWKKNRKNSSKKWPKFFFIKISFLENLSCGFFSILSQITKQHHLPCSCTLLSPPLELKQPWPVWKLFENLRFSLVNRDFRAKPIFKPYPEMTHSNSNRRDPSENFFLSSSGGGQ